MRTFVTIVGDVKEHAPREGPLDGENPRLDIWRVPIPLSSEKAEGPAGSAGLGNIGNNRRGRHYVSWQTLI